MRSFVALLIVALIAIAAYSLYREGGTDSDRTPPSREPTDAAANPAAPQLGAEPAANVPTPATGPERSEIVGADGTGSKQGPTDLPRAEGARIEGRVIDRTGQPVRGAIVRLLGSDGAFLRVDRDLGLSMPSDGNGNFSFADPPAMLGLAIEATAPNFASMRRDIGTLAPGQVHGPVELILEPEITLRGTVKDAEGRLLANTKIAVALADPRPGELAAALATVETNDRGVYEVRGLRRLLYRLLAEKEGYVPLEQQKTLFAVTLKPEATLDFVLEPAIGTVRGRVLDDQDRPVAAAIVSAVADRHVVRTTTSGGGEFELNGLGKAPYRTAVESRGYHAAESLSVRAGETDVVLRVGRNGSLRGRLSLRGGGAPKTAAVDVLKHNADNGRFDLLLRASCESAQFQADDLAPGRYRLVITSLEARRTETEVFEIAPGQPTDLGTVELRRGGIVTGRIAATGASTEGTLALLLGDIDAANPAAQGAALYSEETPKARYRSGVPFRIEHVAPGEYSLLVLPEKGVSRTIRGVRVDDDGTTTIDDVTLGSGGRIYGRVLDVQGISVVRATVRATHGNGDVRTELSDADGYFSFADLEPGPITISLDPAPEIRGAARPVAATVTAGNSSEVELRVRPEGP